LNILITKTLLQNKMPADPKDEFSTNDNGYLDKEIEDFRGNDSMSLIMNVKVLIQEHVCTTFYAFAVLQLRYFQQPIRTPSCYN